LNLPDVLRVVPAVYGPVQVVSDNRYFQTNVVGTTPDYPQALNHHPLVGSFVDADSLDRSARSVVLGQTVAKALFPDEAYPVGRDVTLNGVRFQIVGILEKKSEIAGEDPNDAIFMPLTTARRWLFPNRTQRGDFVVDVIYVQALSGSRLHAAKHQVVQALRERQAGDLDGKDDFAIFSQAEILDLLSDITDVLTIFLGSIAGISLLVGGIGIMNIMLVSVTERTREIGLRKAVGARRRDILVQFLVEAVVLSLIGGLFGILLGAVGARVISTLASNAGQNFRAVVSLKAVFIATLFSVGVGLFFGIYPAQRAARLSPIDALRYE
jgi:putative ABC transport system permease protein